MEVIERTVAGYKVRICIESQGIAIGMDTYGTADEGPGGHPVYIDLGNPDSPGVAIFGDRCIHEITEYIYLDGARFEEES